MKGTKGCASCLQANLTAARLHFHSRCPRKGNDQNTMRTDTMEGNQILYSFGDDCRFAAAGTRYQKQRSRQVQRSLLLRTILMHLRCHMHFPKVQ